MKESGRQAAIDKYEPECSAVRENKGGSGHVRLIWKLGTRFLLCSSSYDSLILVSHQSMI